jgi:cellulose biosynthesis protein BcsQ
MLHNQTLCEENTNFDQVWNNFERTLIRNILEPVRNEYDFILMDCAPGYNLLTRSGIAASDYYLLPSRPEPLSLVGIQLLERRVAKLKESHHNTAPINLKLLGIVFILSGGNLFGRYYKQVMNRITEDFSQEKIFTNNIPMDVNVAKAVDTFMPVVLSMPGSPGAKSFVQLTQEMVQKLN